MPKLKRILAAIDFSAPSRQVVDVALDLARDSRARLTLLYVVEPVDYATVGYLGGAPIASQSILEEHLRAARREMERLRKRKLGALPGAAAVVRIGRPADEIVRAGGKGRSNLIVVGTHGHSGVVHLLLGSVAERVVRRSSCPVLVVPARSSGKKR